MKKDVKSSVYKPYLKCFWDAKTVSNDKGLQAALAPVISSLKKPYPSHFKLNQLAMFCCGFAFSLFFSQQGFTESAEMGSYATFAPSEEKNLPNGFDFDLLHYDEQRYLLAYNVFLMNGRSDLAYKLAESALNHRPNSLLWRKKLIKVALWTNKSRAALEQLIFLAQHDKDSAIYFREAITLAGQIRDFDAVANLLSLRLRKEPNNKDLLIQYSRALQNQGYPEEALTMMQKIPGVESDKDYLLELATIAKNIDDAALEKHYLERLYPRDPHNEQVGLALAELLYREGDIKGAYTIYHTLSKNPEQKIEFWRGYAQLSVLENQDASAVRAYKILKSKKNLDNAEILQLVGIEARIGQKEAAYQDLIDAYRTKPDFSFVPEILTLGSDLGKWDEMQAFLNHLPKEIIHKLENQPETAVALLNLKLHLGFVTQARMAWFHLFHKWPNSEIVQGGYLWYLIDTFDLTQLEYTLARWQEKFYTKPGLWLQYSVGLSTIGDYRTALGLMFLHKNEVNQSYRALSDLSNLLQENNFDWESYYMGQRAFYLLRKEINKKSGVPNIEQTILLSELLQLYSSASLAYKSLLTLNSHLWKEPKADEQVMSFALKTEAYSLASYIANVHKLKNLPIPPWMTLTLALVYNDREAMFRVLRDAPKILPHRDKVRAASRLGHFKQAEEYAYQGLKAHPKDNETYQLFEETMIPRANRATLGTGYYVPGGLIGPYTRGSVKTYLSPSLSMSAYGRLWFPQVSDPTQIARAPFNERTGLAFRRNVEKGWVQASIAESLSMETFMTAKLRVERQWNSKFHYRFGVNYQEPATETTPLVVAGMKNDIDFRLTFPYGKYDDFSLQFLVEEFLGQDRTYLGKGGEVEFHWEHKFYLEYPDWNFNTYLTWGNYQSSSQPLSPALLSFVPANEFPPLSDLPPNASFFMPQSFREIGLTLGFGQKFRQEYTHGWKLFGEAGLLYADPFGLGQLAQFGLGGSVFGRDHLALFTEYSVNQQQASQTNYTIGMRYDNYF